MQYTVQCSNVMLWKRHGQDGWIAAIWNCLSSYHANIHDITQTGGAYPRINTLTNRPRAKRPIDIRQDTEWSAVTVSDVRVAGYESHT